MVLIFLCFGICYAQKNAIYVTFQPPEMGAFLFIFFIQKFVITLHFGLCRIILCYMKTTFLYIN